MMFLPPNYGNTDLTFEQQQQLAKQQGKQANVGKGLDIFGQGLQSFFGYKTAQAGGMPTSTQSYDTYVPQAPPPKSNTGLIVLGVVVVSSLILGTVLLTKKK